MSGTLIAADNHAVVCSIVVCTYNPPPYLLGRALAAIKVAVGQADVACECIVVDNNSDVPVANLDYVQTFIEQSADARVVRESRQGLTYSRIRGLAESAGRFLVFFDDDNEPSPDYLRQAVEAFSKYRDVGVWGPGTIEVEFLDSPPSWVSRFCRHHFQERRTTEVEYACLRQPWHRSYPPGTGQCVRRDVMEAYRERLLAGTCAATDRKGKSLASCGDGQIVHTAITMGLAAGLWPGMSLRHLVPASRCTAGYLQRLAYGVSASLMPATVESFPEISHLPSSRPPSWSRYCLDTVRSAVRDGWRIPSPIRQIQAAARVGDAVGRYIASSKPVPAWLQRRQRLYIDAAE